MTNELATIDPLRTALANAESIADLKDVRDMATAAKAWAKARAMGIGSENEASEYILRAERQIGLRLLDLIAESRYRVEELRTMASPHRRRTSDFCAYMLDREVVTLREMAAQFGLTTSAVGKTLNDSKMFTCVEKGRWKLNRVEYERREGLLAGLVTNESLGLSRNESHDFQMAAAIPDDTFERMLAEARANVTRLAKVNFYRAGREARGMKDLPGTAEDTNFDLFRQGIYGMLGWVNTEDFTGPTVNGLLLLPSDELVQIRVLVEHLAKAWKEATDARR